MRWIGAVATPSFESAGNARQRRLDPRATAAAVEEHADFVAARALFGRQVDDVAKQAAERRAKDVDDPELVGLRVARCGHHSDPSRIDGLSTSAIS